MRSLPGPVLALALAAVACEPTEQSPTPSFASSAAARSAAAPADAAPADATASGPALAAPGLARLLPVIAAAQPLVASNREALSPKLLTKEDPMSLGVSGGRLYGVLFGQKDDPSFVARIGEDGKVEPLGPAPKPRALLPAAGGIVAASEEGLTLHKAGEPHRFLYQGRIKAASSDGATFAFAECASENTTCTVSTMPFKGGEAKRAAGVFPVVNSVALWQGKVYVAGRFRDPREGVPPSQAEIAEQARWMTQGGSLPASARFAPGFVAVVDPAGGEPVYWPFPEHRPVEVLADGDSLWLLTEGTPSRVFSDAVLVRIKASGEWSVLATKLAMPDTLKRSEQRLCWTEMPGSHFTVRCLDLRTSTAHVLVEQEWNVLDYVIDGDTLTWSTLTKGLQRAKLP